MVMVMALVKKNDEEMSFEGNEEMKKMMTFVFVVVVVVVVLLVLVVVVSVVLVLVESKHLMKECDSENTEKTVSRMNSSPPIQPQSPILPSLGMEQENKCEGFVSCCCWVVDGVVVLVVDEDDLVHMLISLPLPKRYSKEEDTAKRVKK